MISDGLINLYKPRGISSAQALARVRRITRVRKSGHAGTLDPAAEGVLLLCLGRATRLVEGLMDLPKVYRARARLDVTSTSFDAGHPSQAVDVAQPPAAQRVAEVLARFEGEIAQVPPTVSALKVGGRPAYELARAGAAVNLPPRPVRIYWLHLHHYGWPELDFELACGRGTYVRALIRDLGRALGTGGCLTGLVRHAVGPWRADSAWTLERLAVLPDAAAAVQPLEQVRALLAIRPVAIPPRPPIGPPGREP
jgi:tRNA pseudouridine55 synthase